MKLKIFSIYDTKALAYGVPFFMQSSGQAIRAFHDLSNDNQSMVFKHPTDFILFEIGEFDDCGGVVESHAPYKHLGIGADFKEVAKPSLADMINTNPNFNGKVEKEVVQ